MDFLPPELVAETGVAGVLVAFIGYLFKSQKKLESKLDKQEAKIDKQVNMIYELKEQVGRLEGSKHLTDQLIEDVKSMRENASEIKSILLAK